MSNLPVYPMGQPPPSPDAARALVDAQNVALHSVLTDLIGGVYDATDAQSRTVSAVGSTLARSLAARVAGQSRQLAGPVNALGQQLQSSLEAQRAALAPSQAAAAQAQAPLTAPRPPAPGAGRSTNPYVPGGAPPPGMPVYFPGGPAAGYIPGSGPAGPQAPGPAGVTPPGSSGAWAGYDPGNPLLNPDCPPPANWPGNVHYTCAEAPPTPGGAPPPAGGFPASPYAPPGPTAPPAFPPGGGPPTPPGADAPPAFDTEHPVPLEPVPVDLPPPLACTLVVPAALQGGIPAPGSPEWCDAFDGVRQFFVGVGNAVVKWATGADGGGVLTLLGVGPASATAPGQTPAGGVLALASVLTPNASQDGIVAAVRCWSQALTAVSACDVPALLALGALDALVSLLERVRVGWDIAVWFTLDLHMPLDTIKRVLNALIEAECPTDTPSVGEAMECFLLGTAPESQVRCWMLMRGADMDVWGPVIRSRREKLTPEESIEWDRRNDVPEETTLDRLRQLGMLDVAERQARLDLYDELPGIADHLHWLQRNVFDEAYVADYGLMDGFEERFWSRYGHDLRAVGMRKQDAQDHYAAHWQNPAPGQLQEMMQRLRPGRVSADVEFTEKDYLRLLAEQDVLPYFRARMRAVAYAPFGLRFLRQIFDTGGISDQEMAERLQDLGYSPADSQILLGSEVIRRAKTRATQARGWNVARAVAAVRSGLLTSDEGFSHLQGQGWTQQEWADALSAADADARGKVQVRAEAAAQKAALTAVLGCYADGVCGRDQAEASLVAQGWTRDLAAVRLEALDLEARRKLVREGVGAIRSAYRAGRLSAADALVQLQQLGLQPGRAAAQVSVWEARQTDHRKLLTGAQITKAVEHGLLSVPEARARLVTLGYADPDALLLLREADLSIRSAAAKALASADKQRAAQIRAQERAVKEAQSLKDKAQSKLKRLTPIAKLMKWLSRGIASEGYVRDRMSAMGYPPDVIDDYVKEAGLPPKKSGKAAPTNGQAAAPPAPPAGP